MGKLFAECVNAFRLFREIIAVDHLIFQLDVRQLVFQLGRVRSFDHLGGRREFHFKYKVIGQSLWIKNAVISQDLMVQIDAVFFPVNAVQHFSASTPEVFASPAPERILLKSSLWMPSGTMLSRFSPGKNRSLNVLYTS